METEMPITVLQQIINDSLYTDGTKNRKLTVGADRSEFDQSRQSFSFMSLKLNKSIFENTKVDEIRAYAGSYTSAAECRKPEQILPIRYFVQICL